MMKIAEKLFNINRCLSAGEISRLSNRLHMLEGTGGRSRLSTEDGLPHQCPRERERHRKGERERDGERDGWHACCVSLWDACKLNRDAIASANSIVTSSLLQAHTKMETLRENHALFSLDPNTRYLKWKHGS